MKIVRVVFFLVIAIASRAQECDILTLDEEIQITQNIALVTTGGFLGDSVVVNVIKKWKGNIDADQFFIGKETLFSDYIAFDTAKTYMLFWYDSLPVNKCSRTSLYKFSHFEYLLDLKFNGGQVVDVLAYDSLKYRKTNIFTTVEGKVYDQSKGEYAFYNLQSQTVEPFKKLPQETSLYRPVRYYEVDSNITTSSKKYAKVFAVGKSHKIIPIDNKLKKEVLVGIYK